MNNITVSGRVSFVKFDVVSGHNRLQIGVVNNESIKLANGEYKNLENKFVFTMFGKRAESLNNAQLFKKGHLVLVTAKIRSNSYSDKNGNVVNGYDMIIDNIELLSRTLDEMIEARDKRENGSASGNYIPDYIASSAPDAVSGAPSDSAPVVKAPSKVSGNNVSGIKTVVPPVDGDVPF